MFKVVLIVIGTLQSPADSDVRALLTTVLPIGRFYDVAACEIARRAFELTIAEESKAGRTDATRESNAAACVSVEAFGNLEQADSWIVTPSPP